MRRIETIGIAAAALGVALAGASWGVGAVLNADVVDPPPPPENCPAVHDDIQTIEADMTLPSEEHPQGVAPSKSYGNKPRLNMGNNPRNFTAIEGWGQLYPSDRVGRVDGAAVEFKNFKVYILDSIDGTWNLIQSSTGVDGAAYREDFAHDDHIKVPTYKAADGGTIAALVDGRNFHFWPTTGRKPIMPDHIGGVFVTLMARLVPDPASPSPGDQWRDPHYVLSIGADYWLNSGAKWDNLKTNDDVGIGRFKMVRPCWSVFNMTTVSPDVLKTNPPPLG
jgi:hypothetical protein